MYLAQDNGYSLAQFFILGIYNTVLDWPDDSLEQQVKKLRSLKYIFDLVKKTPKLQNMIDVIDLTVQRKL